MFGSPEGSVASSLEIWLDTSIRVADLMLAYASVAAFYAVNNPFLAVLDFACVIIELEVYGKYF